MNSFQIFRFVILTSCFLYSTYVIYPVRDLMLVEKIVHARSGVPLGLPCGQPKGTQHITENHVPNATSRALGDTFFYQYRVLRTQYKYFVPNGTLLRRFLLALCAAQVNIFLKNKTHIFDTPPIRFLKPQTSNLKPQTSNFKLQT